MTPEQLDHYREQGYVVLRAFFDPNEMRPWLERLAGLISGEVTDGGTVSVDVGDDGLVLSAG